MAFGLEEQKAFLVPTWQGFKSPSAQQAHWSAVPMCWDVIIFFISSVDRRSFQLLCFPQEAHVGALRCFLPADRWTTQQAALVQEAAHTSVVWGCPPNGRNLCAVFPWNINHYIFWCPWCRWTFWRFFEPVSPSAEESRRWILFLQVRCFDWMVLRS